MSIMSRIEKAVMDALDREDFHRVKSGICLLTPEESIELKKYFREMMNVSYSLSEDARLSVHVMFGIKLRMITTKDVDTLEVILTTQD